jgi:hypothetical protein
MKKLLNFLITWRSRRVQNIVHCTCDRCLAHVRSRERFNKEKIMKTLFATLILAMAIASPALAQRAQPAPQQGYQQNGYYNGYPLSEWYRTDEW